MSFSKLRHAMIFIKTTWAEIDERHVLGSMPGINHATYAACRNLGTFNSEKSPTRIWIAIAGFRIQSANRYTIGPTRSIYVAGIITMACVMSSIRIRFPNKRKQTPRPGIEPGSSAWQAEILTTILSRTCYLIQVHPQSDTMERLPQLLC